MGTDYLHRKRKAKMARDLAHRNWETRTMALENEAEAWVSERHRSSGANARSWGSVERTARMLVGLSGPRSTIAYCFKAHAPPY
jgi:hypothetical protein